MYTLDQIHQKSYSPGFNRLVFAHFCAFHFISAPVSLPYIPCSRIRLQKVDTHRQHIPYNRFLYCTLSYLTLLFSTRSLCSSFNKRVLLKVSYINTTSKKVRKSGYSSHVRQRMLTFVQNVEKYFLLLASTSPLCG